MTKRKGYIPTMTMMLVLAFGSTIANAGIVIVGRAATETPNCSETKPETLVSYLSKVATFAKSGIVIIGRDETPCAERTGIVITGN